MQETDQNNKEQEETYQSPNCSSSEDSGGDSPILKPNQRKSIIDQKPQWLLDVENSLDKFNNQFDRAKRGSELLQQGLTKFNKKQEEQLKIDKENRLKKWQKRMSQEWENEKKNLNEYKKNNSQFNRLNSHIWLIIFQFLDKNIFVQVAQYSRICRKTYSIQQSSNFYKYQISLYMGENFIKLNENNAENIMEKFKEFHQQSQQNLSERQQSEIQLDNYFWKQIMEYYAYQLEKMKNTFRKYQNSGCPLDNQVLMADIVYALTFISDIISLVFLNGDTKFLFYQLLIDFLLNTPEIKGIQILSRLVQCYSELIYNDATDIFITLCALEKMIRVKMKVYLPLNKLLKSDRIPDSKKLAFLLNNELLDKLSSQNMVQKMTKSETFYFPDQKSVQEKIEFQDVFVKDKFVFDSEFCIFGSLSFNKIYKEKQQLLKFISYQITQNLFKYDLENNEDVIKKIQQCYSTDYIQFGVGSYFQRDVNEITQFNYNPSLTNEGEFYALGYCSQGEQISINGKLDLKQAINKIKRNYDFDMNLQSIGDGRLIIKMGVQEKETFYVQAQLGINLQYNQQIITIYGQTDNYQKIILLKLQL